MGEDWREKLGKAYNIEVEEKKEKVKDWEKERQQYEKPKGTNKSGGIHNKTGSYNNSREEPQGKPTAAVATAPYNFVPLVKDVLPSPLQEAVDFSGKNISEQYAVYINKEGKNSGYIELDMKTLTPCFIGGNGKEFFGPMGQPIIPGSTIRGMVKNIFKMITCGAMRSGEDFTDRHLYFRCLMAPNKMPQLKKLHNYYTERMTTLNKEGVSVKKNKPGFLFRTKGKYYICPAEMTSIPRDEYGDFGKESKIDWHMGEHKAYCLTGNQKNKNYVRCLSNPDWDTVYEVPDQVIQEYRDDKNRKGVDVVDGKYILKDGKAVTFAGRSDIDRIAPCFFMREDDEVRAFGHGRSFRIPYKKSVGAHIPQALQTDTVDFADAVFGRKEWWSSRVFFEDGHLEGPAVTTGTNAVKPLLGPNPTSFQLYLEQSKGKFPDHWDTDRRNIRGYKQYWHQDISNEWKDTVPFEGNRKNITHEITPLAKGARFAARIRFENLSDIELGAVLNVFHLGNVHQHIAYKLGQGKSLGMGSIDIRARLYLADDKKYDGVLGEKGWNMTDTEADGANYIQSYQKYLEQNDDISTAYTFVIHELSSMMDWNNTQKPGWKQKVAMMSGDMQNDVLDPRYIEKALLPAIKDIVK